MRWSWRQILSRTALLGICACAGSGSGCGNSTTGTTATISGQVSFQGQPLAGGMIVFSPHPERGPAAKPAHAVIAPDGRYRVLSAGSPYVPAGWYCVAIADSAENSALESPGRAFPAALKRPDRSGVEREVLPGRENILDFHIAVD